MAETPKRSGLFRRLTESLFEDVSQKAKAEAAAAAAAAAQPSALPGITVEEASAVSKDILAALTGKAAAAPPPSAELAVADEVAPSPAALPKEASSLAIEQTHFAARLQEIVSTAPGHGAAGKLQLLNLDELKKGAGDKWEAMAERARHVAQQVISHRLAPSDILAPYDDDSFVVLFAELTEEQARMKAAAIARELRERLLGELGPESKNWVKAFVTGIEDISPVSGEEATDLGLAQLRALDDKFNQADDVAPEQLAPNDVELQRRVGEVGVSYRPTFLVSRGIIGLAEARTQRLDSLNRLLTGANAYPKNDAAVIFEIDRTVMTRAFQHLRDIVKDGRTPGILYITLHLQTLIAHSSGQIIDLLRFLPVELRRFVIVGLNGQPQNAPRARIFELAQEVQPFCRSITLQVPADFHEFERAARMKISAVGLDLEEPDLGEVTPTLFSSQILPMASAARAAGIQSFLYGIRRKEVAKAARDAGFTYLNGPIVAKEIRRPIAINHHP
jgi:GGDEF domain-containing protein